MKEPPRRRKRKLTLHRILKSSYENASTRSRVMNGYVLDDNLSTDEYQTYWNPDKKKLLFVVRGTASVRDIGTDIYLATGALKHTKRYREADRALRRAKMRYHTNKAIVAGHSLGGTIASYIARKHDSVYTHNKGATFGTTNHRREKAYRTKGDPVSYLARNNPGTIHQDKIYKSDGGSMIEKILLEMQRLLGFYEHPRGGPDRAPRRRTDPYLRGATGEGKPLPRAITDAVLHGVEAHTFQNLRRKNNVHIQDQ